MPVIRLQEYSNTEIEAYINSVIERFTTTIAKTGVEATQAHCIAEEKVIGVYFPNRERNDDQLVYHIYATDSATPKGWLWLAKKNQDELRVADIYIEPHDRGNGWGRAAMGAAESIALENNFSMLSLNVFNTNINAKALYLSIGYHIVESTEGKSEMQKKL